MLNAPKTILFQWETLYLIEIGQSGNSIQEIRLLRISCSTFANRPIHYSAHDPVNSRGGSHSKFHKLLISLPVLLLILPGDNSWWYWERLTQQWWDDINTSTMYQPHSTAAVAEANWTEPWQQSGHFSRTARETPFSLYLSRNLWYRT